MKAGISRHSKLILGALIAWLPCGPAAAQASGGTVVEYVDTDDFTGSAGGHFFYSSDPPEQAAVAAGRFRHTGLTFYTGGNTQVCRFYGSVSPGPNSHFFTADPNECAALRALQQVPTTATIKPWNYEGLGFSVQAKLADGSCPPGAIPVHRAYNNGFSRGVDSNHRFSTSRDALDPLINNAGWVYEGIVFCTELPPGEAPLISEALGCGTLGSAGGLDEGTLPALDYVDGGQTTTMPDLDDADEVLFASASAGWALKVRADLLALSSIQSTAVEDNSITTVPGAYGPSCRGHETLSDNPNTYQVSVSVNNRSWKFFDVWND